MNCSRLRLERRVPSRPNNHVLDRVRYSGNCTIISGTHLGIRNFTCTNTYSRLSKIPRKMFERKSDQFRWLPSRTCYESTGRLPSISKSTVQCHQQADLRDIRPRCCVHAGGDNPVHRIIISSSDGCCSARSNRPLTLNRMRFTRSTRPKNKTL